MSIELEDKSREIDRNYEVLEFLSKGEISVESTSDLENLTINRRKPSWRVYDFGSGEPLATDEDKLQMSVTDFSRAVRWLSPRLWTGSPASETRLSIPNLNKFLENVILVGNHDLINGETVFERASLKLQTTS